MPAEEPRYVWLMVFFDLPVKSKKQRRVATKFRKFLVGDGYIMLQYSVYARICRGQEAVTKHMGRLTKSLPEEGSVRSLQVTDTQYARMKTLVGKRRPEETLGTGQMLLL
jgi:CRISPR-associated protein Cas2